jgi:hypothetical protein
MAKAQMHGFIRAIKFGAAILTVAVTPRVRKRAGA